MKNKWYICRNKLKIKTVVIVYYLYYLLILIRCGYVVFGLNKLGWWFLLAILLCNVSPQIKD